MFAYVDELIKKKEFRNLKGLIYFTDGFGNFPAKKPDYETVMLRYAVRMLTLFATVSSPM